MTTGRVWLSQRNLFWLLAGLIIIIMPSLSSQYGMSGDEWVQMDYGRHIWNYFAGVDKQALNYTNMSRQFADQQYYGGLFELSMEALHRLFPSIPILHLRHFFNAFLAAIMMACTGLLAYRFSGKWLVGIVALLFIFFSPRIFGEGMNNPKDIPFACGVIVAVYNLVSLLYRFSTHLRLHAVGLIAGCAIAFGVRPAGFLLLSSYLILFTALYIFFNKDFRTSILAERKKGLKQVVLYVGGSIIAGYLICLAVWPFGQQGPITNLISTISGMANRATYLRNLFEGSLIRDDQMPWYYELKWICISNPLVIIAGVALFIIQFPKVNKQYGKTVLLFLLFAALFPLYYANYKKSTLYDSWRHMFFVYPFWVTMAALGWDILTSYIKAVKYKWVPAGVAVAGLLPAMVWTVRAHPNQYVYFNETVGGLNGAYGYYETDYYQNSGLQAAKWIEKNARPAGGGKIVVRSNMVGFDQYFAKDTSWIAYNYGRYEERNQYDWDYYITYSRYIFPVLLQENKWPPQGVVHQVTEDDVPLCVIIARKNKDGIKGYEAYQAKQYAVAAGLYGNLVKQDSSDPNVYLYYGLSVARSGDLEDLNNLDKGINALNKAIELQPGNPELYFELSKLYGLEGDLYHQQQAKGKADAIVVSDKMGEE